MDSCKSFARKYPVVIAVLTMVFNYALLKIKALFPDSPLDLGIGEVFMAVLIFGWTFLFMGKEKVSLQKEGFGYTFRISRAYLIGLTIFAVLSLGVIILGGKVAENLPLKLLNVLLAGAAVGIVEEFSFRALVFGGIVQKTGNSKNGILTAAVISGLLFGAMHIISSVIEGEVTSLDTMASAAMKTVQTGIFGVILALIYYKTRNLFAVAALHGLNDLILFLATFANPNSGGDSYVGTAGQTGLQLVSYVIFTLIMVPMLVKSIRDLREKEAIPFDDDFRPRAVAYKK